MATHPSAPIQTIKTRKQLIETERNTRKLAQQKRNERKDAFLSAQKQLLKTTDYIEQLDELSHHLTSNIQETYELVTNVNVSIQNVTHHFSQNINEFALKHVDHEMNKPIIASHTHTYDTYDIEALIESFDDINTGHRDYNEAYLMNNIDVPFLSTFNDMSLFRDKIQSCLYSSCIYIDHKTKHKYKDISFDNDYKQNEDDTATSMDAYASYLSAREILIQQLLRFMLIYPSQTKQKESMREYYEETLPFCLYSLMVILYQSSLYMQMDVDDNSDLYALFEAFIKRSKQEIEPNVVQSLQMVEDKPSLLIACLNKLNELVSRSNTQRKNDYHSTSSNITTIDIQWNAMFVRLSRAHASDTAETMECIDFVCKYLLHSSFYECFDRLSQMVCASLSSNFEMLFAKLSTNGEATADDKSFGDIMNSIGDNLSAILTLDDHQTLLQSPLLCAYLDDHMTPFIESSTKSSISRFVSRLESHLCSTNESYEENEANVFSLDEEYLEIGVCCEKLETLINETKRDDAMMAISSSLMQMVSSICSLKLRALAYWSSAMSRKLFADVSSHLESKLSFWNIYESYYTKTVWKSIDDEEELTIHIPCRSSEYIDDICFQFIQILLMIMTQPHVPNSIISVLEREFRLSISQQLSQIFVAFLSTHNDDDKISESFGLQLYFDVSFARAILSTVDANALWDDVLSIVSDEYIELVTMEYAAKYLQYEIQASVSNCLLIYGVNKERNSKEIATATANGGNIFAKPIKKMKRIALLPVASYQISHNNNDSPLNKSPLRMGLLNHSTLLDAKDHQKEKIADSFNQFTSGAMSQANTLLKNFGSMFS